MNEPCRNAGCNQERDGRCTGVACDGSDSLDTVHRLVRWGCPFCDKVFDCEEDAIVHSDVCDAQPANPGGLRTAHPEE